MSGFVHPPTEARAWEALKQAGETDVLTVKGLEGGTDLPIGRACITARVRNSKAERLILHPRDHGCHDADVEWSDDTTWAEQARNALQNKGPLCDALRWNAGAYLWFSGCSESLELGIQRAASALETGQAQAMLDQLCAWRSSLSIR